MSELTMMSLNVNFLTEEQLLQTKDKEDKVIKTRVEDRMKHICTYLQER